MVSQNPKINYKIAEGFAKQIQNTPLLNTFKLLNYRLSQKSWQDLGKGLGNAKNLRTFSCNACNLYEGKNLHVLLKEMTKNTSIESLDFSDNDLSDEHGQVILALIKSTSESRDD